MRHFLTFLSISFSLVINASAADRLNSEIITRSFQESSRYEKVQNYKDAIRALLPVIQTNPKNYAGHLRIGWLYYLQGKYSNSVAHYKMASRTSKGALEPEIGSLLPLLAQEKYTQVEQQAYKIMTVDYYNYFANLRLSIALRKQGKAGLALKVLQRMLKLYPADISFLAQKGLTLQAQGASESAEKIFSKVIALDSENQIAKKFYIAKVNKSTGSIR